VRNDFKRYSYMNKKPDTLLSITRQIQNHLAYLSSLGFKGMDCRRETLERINGWGCRPAAAGESLSDIEAELRQCRKCRLAGSNARAVPGAGNPDARLMFIGGCPEPADEASGQPFSGAGGELLTRMLTAMALSRDSVYISHAFKCVPPGDNPPEPRDIKICRHFLFREIAVVAPEMICTLGDAALAALLDEKASCTRLRGRFHEFKGIALMPTFSPAHLLANPSAKRETWEDMKQVIARLGNPAGPGPV